MSRLEQIEGERWARSTCEEIGALRVRGNNAMNVIEVLQRGLIEKPADYAKGVQNVIDLIKGVNP